MIGLKLPLKVLDGRFLVGADGHQVGVINGERVNFFMERPAEPRANAIAAAVNSHDELVQALKDCLYVMHSSNVPSSARAALAKATGQGDAE